MSVYIKPDRNTKGKREYDRPRIDQPERHCLCGKGFRYPWAWALVLPALTLLDLCSHCARALRYGNEQERREMAEMLASANNDWRLAI